MFCGLCMHACVQVNVCLAYISVCVDILGSISYKHHQCSRLHQLIYNDVFVVSF